MSAEVPVRLERDGPLAVLTLDAPPLNLFDQAMMRRPARRGRRARPPRRRAAC